MDLSRLKFWSINYSNMLTSSINHNYSKNNLADRKENKLMLFDLDVRGHHSGYIQHLVKYWSEQKIPGQLYIVVSPKFVEQHSGIVDIALKCSEKNIKFVSITSKEEAALIDSEQLEVSFKNRIQRAFQEWNLLSKYATSLSATQCLIMYLDTILLRLSLGSRLPCPFSAIYFRPIFHYSSFPKYTSSKQERIWQLRDSLCLKGLLSNSNLQTLFCLDPFAVEKINAKISKSTAIYLPDPVQIYNHSDCDLEELKLSLGIENNRQICLLFGVITQRKGINQLLEAVESLPPEIACRLCLLLIGPLERGEEQELQIRVTNIRESLPVQIICRHDFIADQQIQPYFQISDVILAPYQRHIGMSAILVRAATSGKPILSSDFGLMGEVTRRYSLGLTVDSTKYIDIATALTRFLNESSTGLFEREKIKQFAEKNAADKFCQTIFQHLQLIE
jgi:glycosyltransferase involved in cell wall biosynthesis